MHVDLGRALAFALIGMLGVAPAAARDAKVTVIEHGLYTADVAGEQRDSSGVVTNLLENLCHVATTETVPLRPGVHFGFRYRVDGPTEGELVDLTLAVTFPKALKPPSGPAVRRHERNALLAVGAVSYTGYSFDQDWEFVPGRWTLEVLERDRKLAGVSFTVVDRDGPAPASPGTSSCFKISSL
jgi:hypothetical protein